MEAQPFQNSPGGNSVSPIWKKDLSATTPAIPSGFRFHRCLPIPCNLMSTRPILLLLFMVYPASINIRVLLPIPLLFILFHLHSSILLPQRELPNRYQTKQAAYGSIQTRETT